VERRPWYATQRAAWEGAQARERLTTLRNLLARLTRGTRFWRRTEWVLYRVVRTARKNERYSKATVVSVARPALPPLSGLILSCKWLTASALIDHSSCSSVVPGGLKLYS
jgi:hypothetical protein